ncbi:chromatin remodelling complex Rsc7/Swp82 subunit-domain-containing protein [Flagelloscypha sp. PMI_526]|nr:chromatin remodelling complex Rsc7/Swp82 subunit-domain-containing protein [Flagelloscypha sp. PMI_526]
MSLGKIILKRPVPPPSAPTPPETNEEEESDRGDEDTEDVPMENSSEHPTSEPEAEAEAEAEGDADDEDLEPIIPVKRPRAPELVVVVEVDQEAVAAEVVISLFANLETDDGGDGDQDGEYTEEYIYVPKPQFKTVGAETYVIEGDELIIPDDPKGDEKIDKWGNLLGGRQFKANTFILPNRHAERVYMLAIDAARTSGFRDSLYYFRRNPLSHKLNATQAEKDYLIEIGKLGNHLKTRSVTLITARSVFKLHGAKTVKEGRWIVDDYYEEKVLKDITEKGIKPGEPVGELPDPNANSAQNTAAAEPVAKGDRGGTKGIYQAGGPTTIFGGSGWGPFSDGPLNAVRKSLLSRDGVTEENYMYMAALRAVEASQQWAESRRLGLTGPNQQRDEPIAESSPTDGMEVNADGSSRLTLKKPKVTHPVGFYEAHTGITHYKTLTQPTQAKWETMPDHESKRILGGSKTGGNAWALAWVDHVYQSTEDFEDIEGKEKFVKESLTSERKPATG